MPYMQGVRIVLAEQCWHKSLLPLMDAVRKEFKDIPTYITFDIDAIDPGCCPGTGNLFLILYSYYRSTIKPKLSDSFHYNLATCSL